MTATPILRRTAAAVSYTHLDVYKRQTHLSEIRSTAPEPSVVAYLSSMLARARSRAVGTRSTSWSDVGRFFVVTFPAALYRTRRWWLTTMAINVVVGFAIGWWFVINPQFESCLLYTSRCV